MMNGALKAARRQARRYGEQIRAMSVLKPEYPALRRAYDEFIAQFDDGTDDAHVIIEYLHGEYESGVIAVSVGRAPVYNTV